MKKKVVSWLESNTGEDTLKTVDMTTKDLEYYINLVEKAEVGIEIIDSNFEGSSMWIKCYQKDCMLQRTHS